MKRLFLLLFSFVLFSQCAEKRLDVHVFKVSLWANQNHTWYEAFSYFKDILHERTDGRITIEVYPSEQLAKETESIRLIQAGVIDMTVTASLLSNWIEIAAFCEMPFLLRDEADKDFLINGPLGAQIENEILEKTGLRVLGLFERGQRQLTSNRPIRHPDDLEGMILRVPNVPSFVTAWSAMGAKPTPMAFSEVFTSLQQGTIEGQENPLELILSAGFSEVQQYVNMTNHVMSWSYPLIGEKQFQKLSKELQDIFLLAAKDMQDFERKLYIANQDKVKQKLIDNGMEFIEVDNEAFSKKCEAAIFENLSPAMQNVYSDFVATRPELSKGDEL